MTLPTQQQMIARKELSAQQAKTEAENNRKLEPYRQDIISNFQKFLGVNPYEENKIYDADNKIKEYEEKAKTNPKPSTRKYWAQKAAQLKRMDEMAEGAQNLDEKELLRKSEEAYLRGDEQKARTYLSQAYDVTAKKYAPYVTKNSAQYQKHKRMATYRSTRTTYYPAKKEVKKPTTQSQEPEYYVKDKTTGEAYKGTLMTIGGQQKVVAIRPVAKKETAEQPHSQYVKKGTKNIKPGEGVYFEINPDGSINKDVLVKEETGFYKTGYKLSDETVSKFEAMKKIPVEDRRKTSNKEVRDYKKIEAYSTALQKTRESLKQSREQEYERAGTIGKAWMRFKYGLEKSFETTLGRYDKRSGAAYINGWYVGEPSYSRAFYDRRGIKDMAILGGYSTGMALQGATLFMSPTTSAYIVGGKTVSKLASKAVFAYERYKYGDQVPEGLLSTGTNIVISKNQPRGKTELGTKIKGFFYGISPTTYADFSSSVSLSDRSTRNTLIDYYKGMGYTSSEAKTMASRTMTHTYRAGRTETALQVANAFMAEATSQRLLGSSYASGVKISLESPKVASKAVGKLVGGATLRAGIGEGMISIYLSSELRGQPLSAEQQVIGGVTSGFTAWAGGRIVGGGSISKDLFVEESAKRSASFTKFKSKAFLTAAYTVDPLEFIGDVTHESVTTGLSKAGVTVRHPVLSFTPTSTTATTSFTPTTTKTTSTTLTKDKTISLTPTKSESFSPSVTASVTPSVTDQPTLSNQPTITDTITSTITPTETITTTPTVTDTTTPTTTTTITPTVTTTTTPTPTLQRLPIIPLPANLKGGGGGSFKFGFKKRYRQSKAYTPSFTAMVLGITSTKKPKTLTGMGLRPVIVSKKTTKKRKKKSEDEWLKKLGSGVIRWK